MSKQYKRRVSEKYQNFRPVKKGEIGYGRRWYVNEKTGEHITYREFISNSHIEYGKPDKKKTVYGPYGTLTTVLTETAFNHEKRVSVVAYGVISKETKNKSTHLKKRVYRAIIGVTDVENLKEGIRRYLRGDSEYGIGKEIQEAYTFYEEIEKFYVYAWKENLT